MQQQFQVQGMSCQHCVKAVTRAVQQLDAQAIVAVDLQKAAVTVQSDAARERIVEVIREEGYTVAA